MTAPAGRRRAREGGFSFVEILVVMGIIAVLAGIGLVVVNLAWRKTPEVKTKTLVTRMSALIGFWNSTFRAYPPSNPEKISVISGTSFGVPKLPDLLNLGAESLYLCLQMPGYGRAADLSDQELSNTDGDFLEKPFLPTLSKELFEPKDDYGNPLVYFAAQDYVAADKDPPTYVTGSPDAPEPQVRPRPWKSEKTGEFEQKRSFQLYSMGADHTPNTDDDIKAWE